MSVDRPNILLLFTDMQRFDTIGALGNPHIKTPNLDRLVREGTAFTHAYTPSPVCVPARCSLHYGRYPQQTGCYGNGSMPDDDGTSYVQRLGDAGYRTHAIGKLHFTPDAYAMRGFQSREIQEEMCADPQRDDYLRWLQEHGYDWILDPHGVRGEMYYMPQVAQMPAVFHPTQWIGDRTQAFITEQVEGGRPWYATASFIHPHPPFNPPNPWHKLYRGPNMPLPRIPADRDAHLTWTNRVQNRYKYRDQGHDVNLDRQIKAYYYACISFVDFQVGKILATLEATGQLDSTLILFSSDHGEHLGDYHCYGKRSMHDTSSRIPLLARLPGVMPADYRCERVANLVDIAPTCTNLAGADESGYAGLPLHHVAQGQAKRDHVFSQHARGGEAEYLIATTDWSFFYSAADQREYCYHTAVDPHQQRLVPTSGPWHRDTVQGLRRTLQQYLWDQGEHTAVESVDGALRWKSHPVLTISPNPDDGLLVQDHAWAIPRTVIPGYSTPR